MNGETSGEFFPADAPAPIPPAQFGEQRVAEIREWEFRQEPNGLGNWGPSRPDIEYFNELRTTEGNI